MLYAINILCLFFATVLIGIPVILFLAAVGPLVLMVPTFSGIFGNCVIYVLFIYSITTAILIKLGKDSLLTFTASMFLSFVIGEYASFKDMMDAYKNPSMDAVEGRFIFDSVCALMMVLLHWGLFKMLKWKLTSKEKRNA